MTIYFVVFIQLVVGGLVVKFCVTTFEGSMFCVGETIAVLKFPEIILMVISGFNFIFWHERSALQSVAVRRSTGNDVSGHYFHHYFLSI